MTLTEKVAYLKGLAEGMKLKDSDEATLLNKIIETLGEMADSIDVLEDDLSELYEQVDCIDEDLGEIENDFYECEDDCDCCDDDCDCCDCDEDGEYYEVTCPTRGDTVYLDEDLLLDGGIDCPNCGEELEFDIPCDCCDCDDDCDCEE